MTPDDFQRYVNEMGRIGQETAPLAKAILRAELFIAEHWIAFTIVFLVWYALHLHATWANLRDNQGVDRLTWLLVIWAVPMGLIFYWVLGNRRESGHAFDSTPPRLPPAPRRRASASRASRLRHSTATGIAWLIPENTGRAYDPSSWELGHVPFPWSRRWLEL